LSDKLFFDYLFWCTKKVFIGADILKRGNIKLMKKMNTSLIIREFNNNGPLSRADLTENTGLSPTTITTLIDEMIKDNLIMKVGEGESSGGRKPILLDLNPKHGYILSGWISGESISIALLDIKYNITDIIEKEIIFPTDQNLILEIKNIIEEIISTNNLSTEKILGLMLGISGIINQQNGTIKYSALLDLENFSIREPLSKHFPFPINIENDTNLAALSEKEFGHKHLNNYIYLMIAPEIGSGIIIDNEIYRGRFGRAGEFGHLLMEKDGPRCTCGRKGCLAPVLSQYIPINKAQKFRNAFKDLEPGSKKYEKFCDYLAIALTNYIHLIDNEAIIFGGELVKIASEKFYSDIEEKIMKYSMKNMYDNVKVLPASLSDNEVIMGGASFCFHNSKYFTNKEG